MNTAGGQNSVHRLRDATQGPPFASSDQTNNGNDLTSHPSASYHPAVGASGATFGLNDYLAQSISGGTFTVVISFTKDDASGTSANASLLTDNGSNNVVHYQDGSTGATGGTVFVGGNIAGNRDALYDALHQTGRQVVEMQGLDMTGDTELRLGRFAAGIEGLVDWFIVIDEADFPTNLAEVRSWAVDAAGADT